MRNNVLIICAHSDDEVIGCGGAISYHLKKKDKVYCVYLTDGVSARKNNEFEILKRAQYEKKSEKYLGFRFLDKFCGKLKDQKLDEVPLIKIIKIIEEIKKKINPNILYTHFPNDLNKDHRIVSEATNVAFRPYRNSVLEKFIYFEIPSTTGISIDEHFVPNYYLDISKFINKKIRALKCYKSEIKKNDIRSLEALKVQAKARGLEAGFKYAEAFYLKRFLIK